MTIEIKELMSSDLCLVDVTDSELRQMNGGYAAIILGSTGSPQLASNTAVTVLNRPANQSTFNDQVRLGVPFGLIQRGVDLANSQGGGVYTPAVTFQKLGR